MRLTISGCFFILVTVAIGKRIDHSRYKTRVRRERSSYIGLFLSEDEITSLKSRLQEKTLPVYTLSSATERMALSVSCGSSEPTSTDTSTGSACGVTESTACCETVLEVIQPETVTDVLSGITYNVSTSHHGVQILHIGKCAEEGIGCSLGGICLQENRISWVLVDTGVFVTVQVPNHCVCTCV